MKGMARNKGLSLTEVLLAAGILVLGFLLIAGTFPVGIKLTSLATERTISLIAAQEAAGKIKLYGIQPESLLDLDNTVAAAAGQPPGTVNLLWEYGLGVVDPNGITAFWRQARDLGASDAKAWEAVQTHLNDLRRYPSVAGWQVEDYRYLWAPTDPEALKRRQRKLLLPDGEGARYFWTALCRRIPIGGGAGRDVQVTVFVGRKAGAAVWYPRYDPSLAQGPWTRAEWPAPVPIMATGPKEDWPDPDIARLWLDTIRIDSDEYSDYSAEEFLRLGDYFKEGARIVDGRNGRIMHVGKVLIDRDNGLVIISLLPAVNATPNDPSDDGLFEMRRPSNQFPPVLPGDPRPVWVMPPAMREAMFDADNNGELEPPMVGGRYPGVGVYQWVLSF